MGLELRVAGSREILWGITHSGLLLSLGMSEAAQRLRSV